MSSNKNFLAQLEKIDLITKMAKKEDKIAKNNFSCQKWNKFH